MQQKIAEYFEACREHTEEVMSASGAIKNIKRPLVPTQKEMLPEIGLSLKGYWNYGHAEGYEDYYEIVEHAELYIEGKKMSALVNGKGSTQGLIFDLINNYGMRTKNEKEAQDEAQQEVTVNVVYKKTQVPLPILPNNGQDHNAGT